MWKHLYPGRPLQLLLSAPAAIFYCAYAQETHRFSEASGRWLAVAALMADVLFRGSGALWVLLDSRQSGASLPYDLVSFVFFLLALAAVYIFTRHGRGGWRLIGWGILLVIAGGFFAWLPEVIAGILTGRMPNI